METIEHFSNFLMKIGVPNFLTIGIAAIVIWLLISGVKKGLKRRKENRESEDDENDNDG
jgi:hypothetical protein